MSEKPEMIVEVADGKAVLAQATCPNEASFTSCMAWIERLLTDWAMLRRSVEMCGGHCKFPDRPVLTFEIAGKTEAYRPDANAPRFRFEMALLYEAEKERMAS